jgi:tetratricopeptide (TPR) repeat protein
MHYLWKKDASVKEKLCNLILLVALIGALIGHFSNFELSEYSIRLTPFIVFAISLLFFRPSLSLLSKLKKYGNTKQRLLKVVWFLIIYFLFFMAIAIGLPSVLANYIGNEFSYRGMIVKKYTIHQRTRTFYHIRIQEFPSLRLNHYRLKKEKWHSLTYGEIVSVSGREFILGRGISSVQLVRDVDFYKTRGDTYYQNGQYEMALSDFHKIIELDPDYFEAYKTIGDIHFADNKFHLSLNNYTKAIALNPSYYKAYSGRSRVYIKKGEYDNAIEDFNKMIALNPRDSDAHRGKGSAYLQKDEYDKAIESYSKAIDINRWQYGAYRGRAKAYFRKGEYEMAIGDYSKAIELKPTYPHAYNDRGYIYTKQGEHEKACADFNFACQFGRCDPFDRAKNKGYCK